MGFNKALLEIDGKPLIRILSDRVRNITDQIFVSSNDLFSYGFLGYPVIADEYKEHGPLAGLHAAMLRSTRSLFLLVACDLPNIHESLMRNLIMLAEGFDAVIPMTRDGIIHPLSAVYRRTCLSAVDRQLQLGAGKAVDILLDGTLGVRWVTPEEGQFEDLDLANLNSPEALCRWKRMLGRLRLREQGLHR